MDRYTFSGYPTRDPIPRGYTFYQFVVNFRNSGGYGNLVPRAAAPIAPPTTPQHGPVPSQDGSGPVKGARDLTATSQAIEEATTKVQDSGEFDATEGEAELKWRDPNAR